VWNRRTVRLSELHQERLLQLPRSFVVRRTADAICLTHQVRPRNCRGNKCNRNAVAFAGTFEGAALLPNVAQRGSADLKAIRLRGKSLLLEMGILRLKDSSANSMVALLLNSPRHAVPEILGKRLKATRRVRIRASWRREVWHNLLPRRSSCLKDCRRFRTRKTNLTATALWLTVGVRADAKNSQEKNSLEESCRTAVDRRHACRGLLGLARGRQ